jgi:HEAT repeat protein/energy-coupling factor transporter ATP-binding protein EcfA2
LFINNPIPFAQTLILSSIQFHQEDAMPEYTGSEAIGKKGIKYIENIVEEMGYIWRENTGTDIGIDGEIEIVEGGQATGEIIKVQSKAGESYIRNEKPDCFTYYADFDHTLYWNRVTNPVILVVYDPRINIAYWVDIQNCIETNPIDIEASSYKILFEKKVNRFTPDSAQDLQGLFEPTPQKQLSDYRQHLINQYSKLTLYSVKSDKPLSVELERVFVKLSMIRQEKKERPSFTTRGKKWFFDPNDSEEERIISFENLRPEELYEEKRVTLSISEALQQNKRLVIVGAPGAGKTTLLKYLAISFAQKPHKEKFGIDKERIPILLFLRDFSRFLDNQNQTGNLLTYKADLLPQFLYEYYDQAAKQLNLSKEFFNRLLEGGKCLVLMDGLDEVADPIKRGRITEIVSSITQQYDKNQFIISSRPRGYEGEAKQRLSTHCADCLIRDFDEDNMSEFTRGWYKAVTYERLGENEAATREAEIYTEDLLRRIKAEPHVKALATNPLLLSILAMVHQRDTTLPQRRAELYDECTQMLLGYWDQVRGGEAARELATAGDLDRNEKRALLEPVALWFHLRGESGKEADKEDLQKEIARQFVDVMGESPTKAKLRAAEFLKIIDERSGLLVEREIGTYSFAHLTFQEYLAARAIADGEEYIEETLKHLHDPWWKEVILLEAGHLSDVSGNPNRARRLTTKLIESIYLANSPYEEILRRDLLFAARAVVDVGKLGMSEELRQQIVGAVIELWRTTPFSVQRQECEALFVYAAQTKLGDLILERLIALTSDANADVRRYAASALGNLGEAAATDEMLSHLIDLTKDTDDSVRRNAVDALGKFGEAAATDEVLSHLIDLIKDADNFVRWSAIDVLGKFGEAAATTEVLSRLVDLIEDADDSVRRSAADVLGKFGEAAATTEVLSRLVDLIEDADDSVRRSAAFALGKFGEAAATTEILSRLVDLIKDADDSVRQNAIYALGNLGKIAATNEVLSHLLVLISDGNDSVRQNVVYALGNLGKLAATDEVLSHLLVLISDGNDSVRMNMAGALGKLGKVAATDEVPSHLVDLIKDTNDLVQSFAASALANLGEAAATDEVLSRLLALISDGNKNAAVALGYLGEAAATDEVLSRLLVLISDSDDSVRSYTAYVLNSLGAAAANDEVVSHLLALTGDSNYFVRMQVASALSNFGEAVATNEVISHLLVLTNDAHPFVRSGAAGALGKLGKVAATDEVLSRLVDLIKDADDSVRRGAAYALDKLNITSRRPDLVPKLISLWEDKLSDASHGRFDFYKTSDMAYYEISKIVSQLPPALTEQ